MNYQLSTGYDSRDTKHGGKDTMLTSDDIRQKFLDFFNSKGHTIVESDSLIPSGDPTLLFTSAGMVQFKNMFLDSANARFKRAASSQKCFRTSDLDIIGTTARHHTFFEMLGNFSFGDYFKKEAIEWGWEFLTQDLKIPKERLYASIYKDDDEALKIWIKILPEEKIVRLGEEANFWKMGDTGPCGPCSEILYDMGAQYSCGKETCSPGCDCDRYLEVWNLVFTQFDRDSEGNLIPLPKKNIDTGMGLERLTAVIQNVSSNFNTDLIRPIIDFVCDLGTLTYGKDKKTDIHLNIIADHARAITFLIADGVLPSNEGRGYVLRRILRRALRQGKLLGINKPFLYKVTSKVIDLMKSPYPYLKKQHQQIAEITSMEEEKFLQTLEDGLEMLNNILSRMKKENLTVIDGTDVFRLYDTYGFPFDLTYQIARENDLSIDEEGFNNAMQEQRTQSREHWKGSGEADTSVYVRIHNITGDTAFRGHEFNSLTSHIVSILKDNVSVKEAHKDDFVEIVLAETPFYGESGGQIGDTGKIINSPKLKTAGTNISLDDIVDEIEVANTKKPVDGLIVHRGRVIKGSFKLQETVVAYVDPGRRKAIERSHTCTHILQAVLRKVLGDHVTQAGSLVEPDRFRFDYTNMKALDDSQLSRVEELVNAGLRENFKVFKTEMTLAQANKIGAMALFGEKYKEDVRVVIITHEGLNSPEHAYSIELCGGTHCNSTGDIGMFKLISESSIASGVRRIEALTGEEAYKYTKEQTDIVDTITQILRVQPEQLTERLEKLLHSNKELQKELQKLKGKLSSTSAEDYIKDVVNVSGVTVLQKKIENVDRKALLSLGDQLKDKLKSAVIVLATVYKDKVILISIVTDDLIKKGLHAGNIIKSVSEIVGGTGGGRPDMAQAGGKDIKCLDKALKSVPEIVKGFIKS